MSIAVDALVQFAGIVALCVRSASSNDGSRVNMTLKLVIHLVEALSSSFWSFATCPYLELCFGWDDGSGGGEGSGEGTPHTPPRGKPLSVYRKPLRTVR